MDPPLDGLEHVGGILYISPLDVDMETQVWAPALKKNQCQGQLMHLSEPYLFSIMTLSYQESKKVRRHL